MLNGPAPGDLGAEEACLDALEHELALSLRWTLCFLLRADSVLLLRRANPPGAGLWNGVGGKLHPGETPESACLREVHEETGYEIEIAHFVGAMTWEPLEAPDDGIYLYVSEAPLGEPQACEEGELRWHALPSATQNRDVAPWVRRMLPAIVGDGTPVRHHFVFAGDAIESYRQLDLVEDDWC